MKLRVYVEKHRLYKAEVEVEGNDLEDPQVQERAKKAIESLTNDDLREMGQWIATEVLDDQDENVEGKIRPSFTWVAL